MDRRCSLLHWPLRGFISKPPASCYPNIAAYQTLDNQYPRRDPQEMYPGVHAAFADHRTPHKPSPPHRAIMPSSRPALSLPSCLQRKTPSREGSVCPDLPPVGVPPCQSVCHAQLFLVKIRAFPMDRASYRGGAHAPCIHPILRGLSLCCTREPSGASGPPDPSVHTFQPRGGSGDSTAILEPPPPCLLRHQRRPGSPRRQGLRIVLGTFVTLHRGSHRKEAP